VYDHLNRLKQVLLARPESEVPREAIAKLNRCRGKVRAAIVRRSKCKRRLFHRLRNVSDAQHLLGQVQTLLQERQRRSTEWVIEIVETTVVHNGGGQQPYRHPHPEQTETRRRPDFPGPSGKNGKGPH
jgi:hypothetical protein